MSIPNLTYIVEQTKNEHPEAWKNAHTGNAYTEDFIRLVAPKMFAVDRRFGLNGKRGNPLDISDDAVNVVGEGPGTTPGGQPCTVIDIIGGAGGPNPQPQWGVQTDPVAASGAWVNPNSAPGLPPSPQPTFPSYESLGGDTFFRVNVGVPLEADMALAGQALNEGSSVWFSRTCYDLIEARLKDPNADPSPIVKKHRNEWRAILGLPPL